MTIKTRWLLPFAALALAACDAQTTTADPVVSDAWARETLEGQPMGAAYFTITNEGSDPIKLVGVSSDASNGASLHSSVIENGVASMRAIEGGLVIDAGESATLEPGGDHVMFEGLTGPLAEGSTVPLTLRFEDGSEMTVDVAVVGAGER
ncbi:copper chaperone PCu(A)C [Sphingomicrobium clamense]|uniref:Copper chaperone PCu(A)C n=1 Tax=Sphingomicrobium clamense TaxID=2851013 RepID=A0ABS6V7V0_9SPHN|nr:copper chaperone PCu(A)C [Sphingomicrobium sp. B8]MBW0145556.1 copper chaperone PCu(A)C [Sphingomicrobium sp. B8]